MCPSAFHWVAPCTHRLRVSSGLTWLSVPIWSSLPQRPQFLSFSVASAIACLPTLMSIGCFFRGLSATRPERRSHRLPSAYYERLRPAAIDCGPPGPVRPFPKCPDGLGVQDRARLERTEPKCYHDSR